MRILLVCTGNLCRSPVAERLLQRWWAPCLQVESAGTHPATTQPVPESMLLRLDDWGFDRIAVKPRQLTEDVVSHADLILGMDRSHRRQVVELSPAAVKRTFTYREFARLVSAPAPVRQQPITESIRTATKLAQSRRRPVDPPGADDIEDPYGRSDRVVQRVLDELLDTTRTIVGAVGRCSTP